MYVQYICLSASSKSLPSSRGMAHSMAPAAPPPNPCLVAILLIIQSRSGPHLVFHYPSDPLSARSSHGREVGDASTPTRDLSSSDTEAFTTSTEDDETTLRSESKQAAKNQQAASPKPRQLQDTDDGISGDEDANRRREEWRHSYEPLFGLEGLVTLLTPSDRIWHKRKFEFGINDLCFLGWPVFMREDGTWQKRKIKSNKRTAKRESSQPDAEHVDASGTNTAPMIKKER